MPVHIPTLGGKVDYDVQTAFRRLQEHAQAMEIKVTDLTKQIEGMRPGLTMAQIQAALSAGGTHPLNLSGLAGNSQATTPAVGSPGGPPPDPPVPGPCGPSGDHTDVVQTAKDQLIAESVDITGTCGAYAIVERAISLLQAAGEACGPHRKLTGNNCMGHSYNRICYAELQDFQVLTSAGTANDPVWIYTGQLTDPLDYEGPACP